MEKYILTEPFATGYLVAGYTVLRLSPMRGELKADAVDVIVARYREVFVTAQVTPREQDSVVGQLKFIQEMLELLGGNSVKIETIKAILKGLTGEDEKSSKKATATPVPKKKRGGGARGVRKKG